MLDKINRTSMENRIQVGTNTSVVKSEVGMWSGPLRGPDPFHSDFGTMR